MHDAQLYEHCNLETQQVSFGFVASLQKDLKLLIKLSISLSSQCFFHMLSQCFFSMSSQCVTLGSKYKNVCKSGGVQCVLEHIMSIMKDKIRWIPVSRTGMTELLLLR
ncbi:hypothetical protein [Wolbachia endosymbiont of Folsomia candida]|uniref:hypothetical protein n=1 Tax=Wolbachia endosymbiont of Folsomia candida TaxID=169402 RepID=UPI00138FE8D0|nr:hypothetical protein [Wolbachia endosymbiont of Folsomia candida]